MLKKNSLLFFVLAFLFIGFSYSQNFSKIDSVIFRLKITLVDSEKVNLNSQLGQLYSHYKPDSAILFYKKALDISQKNKLVKKIATCQYKIAVLYKDIGNYDKAKDYNQSSLITYEELSDKAGIANCNTNFGIISEEQSLYTKAMNYYLKALKIEESLGDKKGIAECYNNIGAVLYYQGDYNKAIDYYLKSLKIKEESGDRKSAAACYGNIGVIYKEQHDFDKALMYDLKCLEIYESLGNQKGMSGCYNNIGEIYGFKNEDVKAMEYYYKSLKIYEALGDKNGMAFVYTNIAYVNNLHNDFYDAIKNAQVALNIAEKAGALNLQMDNYEILSSAYEGKHDYKRSLEYHKLFKAVKDSIFNESSSKQVKELEAKYQNEKDQKEIEILEKDKKLKIAEIRREQFQKYGFIGGFLFMVLLAIVIFSSYKQKHKDNQLLAQQKTELERINRSKNEILGIVAHDLRNPIGNVYAFSQLILDDEEEELSPNHKEKVIYILDLSKYMLHLVNNLLEISVIESGVLKLDCISSNYVAFIEEEVLKNRANAAQHNIKIEFEHAYSDIIVSFDRVKMQQVINNLISNAIKYSKDGDTIDVSVTVNGNIVYTSVKDYGPGISEEYLEIIFNKYTQLGTPLISKEKGTGLGLSIVKGIITAHDGRIYVQSVLDKGSEFIYELPLSS